MIPPIVPVPLAPALAAWLTAEAQRAGLDLPSMIQVILLQTWEAHTRGAAPPPRLAPAPREGDAP